MPLLEPLATRDHRTLRRRPRAQPTPARPLFEVFGRLPRSDTLHTPLDPHLPLERRPPEAERGARVDFLELAALSASVVREEDESALVRFLEQHHPATRHALRIGARECHRVRLWRLGLARLGEPTMELGERIGGDVTLIQLLAAVLLSKMGDAHAESSVPQCPLGKSASARCFAGRVLTSPEPLRPGGICETFP